MNDKILLSVIKPFLPKIKGFIKEGEPALKKYLESIPLQGDETHIVAFTEIDENTIYVVIGAFRDKTFVRAIQVTPLASWLTSLIENAIKNENAG